MGRLRTWSGRGSAAEPGVTSAGRATDAPGDASEAEWVVAGDRDTGGPEQSCDADSGSADLGVTT